ncbi:hypothetical protein [Mesorhizobium sp. IMUNJ 23232]|uniref:hypothetical protein n=1 Tax=Mesorhizobium sp. IMUNJ 23232 TaxID=3376064 RepID=UPI00379C3AAE
MTIAALNDLFRRVASIERLAKRRGIVDLSVLTESQLAAFQRWLGQFTGGLAGMDADAAATCGRRVMR